MASMSEFRGFSDREIRNLQQQEGVRGVAPLTKADLSRKRPPPQIMTRNKIKTDCESSADLPTTAYSAKQPQPSQLDQTGPNYTKTDHQEPRKDQTNQDCRPSGVDTTTNAATQESSANSEEPNLPHLHTDTQCVVETQLELLQKQQKELEHENKKKKALLEQTLQERYAKSQIEARKLQEVKEELARLDGLLNRDVTILRAKIEGADRHYTSARKRYETAETEFVAAKLALHKASEVKELLSGHLCTIIQQNELRKAEKLAELLKTLELESQAVEHANRVLSGHVLFQKTPTPGSSIWPRERQLSMENSGHSIAPDGQTVEDSKTTHPDSQHEPGATGSNSDSDKSGLNQPQNSTNDQNTPLISL